MINFSLRGDKLQVLETLYLKEMSRIMIWAGLFDTETEFEKYMNQKIFVKMKNYESYETPKYVWMN